MLYPAPLKTFFEECVKEFVEIRQLPAKLKNGNDKAMAYLEEITTNCRIAPQLKYDIKPLLFGHHELQIAAAATADQKIQALIGPFQTACQKKC